MGKYTGEILLSASNTHKNVLVNSSDEFFLRSVVVGVVNNVSQQTDVSL